MDVLILFLQEGMGLAPDNGFEFPSNFRIYDIDSVSLL